MKVLGILYIMGYATFFGSFVFVFTTDWYIRLRSVRKLIIIAVVYEWLEKEKIIIYQYLYQED